MLDLCFYEAKVLDFIEANAGATIKEIAEALDLSISTVTTHCRTMRKARLISTKPVHREGTRKAGRHPYGHYSTYEPARMGYPDKPGSSK